MLRPSKEILIKIGGLLAALFILSMLALAGLRRIEAHTIREILQAEEQEHGRLLDGVVHLSSSPLRLMVEGDVGRYRSALEAGRPDQADVRARFEAATAILGLDGAWLVDSKGEVRLRATSAGRREVKLALAPEELAQANRSELHFFAEDQQEIFEWRGRRLAGAEGASSGWILAATRLDGVRLTQPFLPVEGYVSLEKPTMTRPDETPIVRIDRILADYSGKPLRILRLTYLPDEVDATVRAGELSRRLILIFVLWSLSVLGFSLWRWVVRPAMLMEASLSTRDVKRLDPLFAAGGDLARLAGFVRNSLENHDSLQRTMAERARLGRDLHDGVIQTIYSAGLGLARGRNYLASDPAKAEALLLEVRASLDEAVRDLRRYISSAESEPALVRNLQESLRNLKVIAHLEPGCAVDLAVESEAEAKLSAEKRAEILFIAGEAFSNGIRHGGATKLEFSLTCRGTDLVLLRICDNGRGFDPASSRNPFGQGMSNLRNRAARLGGVLHLVSSPGRGTELEIEFIP